MSKLHIDTDFWEEIYDSLTRNKTRTFLTAFGVFWGIFMLILLMGGGKGLESMLAENFAGFATNSGFVGTNQTSEPYNGFRKGRRWDIELPDINRIKNSIPEIEIITPLISRWGCNATNYNKQINVTVKGIHPEYGIIENPEIKYGRMINEVDTKLGRKVCIIGKRVVEELYIGTANPCGMSIQIDGVYYKIIGVSGKGSGGMSINGNPETSIIIPFTTIQRAYNRGNKIDLLCFTARKGYNISDVQDKVERVLKRAHNISPTDTQAVIKVNAEAIFGMIDTLFKGINILVWMIGLGTLISGAIGVSNIMVVTVKERTSEIGIRRAIGATSKDILTQIMSESIVLTLVAGFSGITFGVLCLQLLENIARVTTPESTFQISFGIAIGATIILITLGIIAGLTPTYRAMAIKPVDAIRDE